MKLCSHRHVTPMDSSPSPSPARFSSFALGFWAQGSGSRARGTVSGYQGLGDQGLGSRFPPCGGFLIVFHRGPASLSPFCIFLFAMKKKTFCSRATTKGSVCVPSSSTSHHVVALRALRSQCGRGRVGVFGAVVKRQHGVDDTQHRCPCTRRARLAVVEVIEAAMPFLRGR